MLKTAANFPLSVILVALIVSVTGNEALAQSEEHLESMFNEAGKHFANGEYRQAISIYDEILEIAPNNISTLKMKGITHINSEEHTKSLKQFFKILQHRPNDPLALTGMGVGFGNLGEYKEALDYFEKASLQKPDSTIIKNYNTYAEKVIEKYPYSPTQKPPELEKSHEAKIPDWVKNNAGWWSDGSIGDEAFVSALMFLIENKIILIPPAEKTEEHGLPGQIPDWVKNNAGWWSDGSIGDEAFVSGIQFMVEKKIIVADTEEEKTKEDLDREFYFFSKYLRDISNNISKEKRYIEFPNPSQDVIKKFSRDYVKWNFDEEAKKASGKFPDPTFVLEDGKYVIHYKVYVNEQPTGLPLDHVETLANSLEFWERQDLSTNNQKAKIEFEITDSKHEANVWVTWVVRNLGDGVLGHAHLGKGIVEVTLGDYDCDGSFQLYDVSSVEKIMTHELGHSVGLKHVDDKTNIMYPSLTPSYAYCLLG